MLADKFLAFAVLECIHRAGFTTGRAQYIDLMTRQLCVVLDATKPDASESWTVRGPIDDELRVASRLAVQVGIELNA